MEKMEHMDPQRCDRIWQRVSPELDPYPEVRAACREPSREPGAGDIPERAKAAAVPAAPEIPAEPAESGCCLAGDGLLLSAPLAGGTGGESAVAGGAADPVSRRDLRRSALCTGGRGHGGRVSAGDMGGAVGGGISPCPAAAEPVGADGACIVRRMVLSYGKHRQQRRISHERAHQPGGGVGRPAEV